MDNNLIVKITLRKADPEDLKRGSRALWYGKAYAVINNNGKTISGLHIIDENTDPYELAFFLKQDRLLVPVSCLESNIEIVKADK